MKKLAVLLTVILCGCATNMPVTSVKQPWPELPAELSTSCPELKLVDTNTSKLSDVLDVVTDNYAEYKECKVKVDAWIDWYSKQKQIYESVK